MKAILLWICMYFFAGKAAFANTNPPGACPPAQIATQVEYEFKDLDLRQDWIYSSLRPTVGYGSLVSRALNIGTKNGRATFAFCLPSEIASKTMEFHFGSQSVTIEPRPITNAEGTQPQMAQIFLFSQPRPTWVIVKSATRASASGDSPAIYELELYNFGAVHPGGEVRYSSQDLSGRCAFPASPNRVTVQVAIVGQRLKVQSNDPEYAEDLVSRQAELEQNSNQCAGNFKLNVSLGKTGRLQPGPVRIRYVFREVMDSAKPLNVTISKYFLSTRFRLQVDGDDIWSSDTR